MGSAAWPEALNKNWSVHQQSLFIFGLRQVLPLLGTRTCCQPRPTHVRCSAPLGYTIAPSEGIEMRELYITINVFSLFGPRFLIIQS